MNMKKQSRVESRESRARRFPVLPSTLVPRPSTLLCFCFLLSAASHAATTYITDSASRADVQAKIDLTSNGDTVAITNGSATYTSALSLSGKQITIKALNITEAPNGTDTTNRNVTITHSAGSSALISFTTDDNNHCALSGIKFLRGSGTGEYLTVSGSGSKIAKISECYFDVPDNGSVLKVVFWTALGGLFYNCMAESLDPGTFELGPGSGSGCIKLTSPRAWSTASTMGTNDVNGDVNVYFEDCTFNHIWAQCIDTDDNARVVVRYSTVRNSQFLTHGSTSIDGGRFMELYNNDFRMDTASFGDPWTDVNVNRYVWFRAGTGIFTDNTVENITSSSWGNKDEFVLCVENAVRAGEFGCATSYPTYHQIGYGHNGSAQVSDPVYYWNNTGTVVVGLNDGDNSQGDCGGTTSTYCQVNRDYYTSTAKTNYGKFTYPHPLRDGAEDTTDPTVAISTPTSSATYSTPNAAVTVSGTASDDTAVTSVTWSNDRGGSGSATGTTSWSKANLPLFAGVNVITITAADAAANDATDVITVTRTLATGTITSLNVIGTLRVSP